MGEDRDTHDVDVITDGSDHHASTRKWADTVRTHP
jgi:hypothetical protein